jgi:hypothetical protein
MHLSNTSAWGPAYILATDVAIAGPTLVVLRYVTLSPLPQVKAEQTCRYTADPICNAELANTYPGRISLVSVIAYTKS